MLCRLQRLETHLVRVARSWALKTPVVRFQYISWKPWHLCSQSRNAQEMHVRHSVSAEAAFIPSSDACFHLAVLDLTNLVLLQGNPTFRVV